MAGSVFIVRPRSPVFWAFGLARPLYGLHPFSLNEGSGYLARPIRVEYSYMISGSQSPADKGNKFGSEC